MFLWFFFQMYINSHVAFIARLEKKFTAKKYVKNWRSRAFVDREGKKSTFLPNNSEILNLSLKILKFARIIFFHKLKKFDLKFRGFFWKTSELNLKISFFF